MRKSILILVVLIVAAFSASWFWLAPGAPMTPPEISNYLERLESGMVMDDPEKSEFLSRLRHWAEGDDGQPVHMINLIRFRDPMQPVPGYPEFTGTAEEANAYYEQEVTPLLAARGIYPVLASSPQGLDAEDGELTNLMEFNPELDRWDRVMLVRYPSRRAFLDLLTDPTYMKLMPFKTEAIDLLLVPLDKHFGLLDPRWIIALVGIALLLGMAALNTKNISNRRAA